MNYDTRSRDYPVTTPLFEIDPKQIRIQSTDSNTLAFYQKKMSKAVWRPAPGRKLGFLVTHGTWLLGIIFLASPVIRLQARDAFLFPNAPKDFNYGIATKNYMDVSVCVASQPIGWHWNLGKLMAMIAPTLGDYFTERYGDELRGVTTTSLWGTNGTGLTQYSRVYEYLGETKGHGHAHVSSEKYQQMKSFLRARCPNCSPNCPQPLPLIPKFANPTKRKSTDALTPKSDWCTVPYARFGDGANARMRCIQSYIKASGEELTLHHGKIRGVYYHPAIPPEKRREVIQKWYERWGLPRYQKTGTLVAPYQNGIEGRTV